MAIPRGGVVLGRVVADRLGWPLDLVITRKVSHPDNPEFALCVVAEDGHVVGDEAQMALVDPEWLKKEKDREMAEASRRRQTYVSWGTRPSVAGKTVVVVDDGVATGLTLLGALGEVRERKPACLVVAVPVMPAEFKNRLEKEADEVVCVMVDENYLGSVGAYYDDFPQVSDEEVVKLMGGGS